jgi:diguanylate cyclase (GGDEF)-like protein
MPRPQTNELTVDWIRRWWRQPDHYDWLSDYLESQGQQRPIRIFLAVTLAVLSAIPVLIQLGRGGPSGAITVIVMVTATGLCLAMAAMWLRRWPTRTQSRVFAIGSAVCVGVACVAEPDPQAGLIGCSIFAAIAGLVAFTHTSPYLALICGIALATVAGCAAKIAMLGDPLGGVSKAIIVLVGIVTVPGVGQIMVQMLGTGAVQSDVDALTGLHNRRGFYRGAAEQITRARSYRSSRVGVVLVDIDDFKRINDTEGHAAGDRVLIAVAATLRRVAGKSAVTARVGGEEFLIAMALGGSGLRALAERVRAEVDHLPHGVTISVGAACTPSAADGDIRSLLDRLVELADEAMYTAKRAGGNRIDCRELDAPPPSKPAPPPAAPPRSAGTHPV